MKDEIVLYQPDSTIQLEVRLQDETVWLSQQQMTVLFDSTKQNISLHINNIYKEGELQKSATVKEYLTVQNESGRWLIVDEQVYHCGHSLKDMGRKLSAVSLLGIAAEDIIKQII